MPTFTASALGRLATAICATLIALVAPGAALALPLPFERVAGEEGAFVARAGHCALHAEGSRLRRRCGAAELTSTLVGARAGLTPTVGPPTTTIRRQVGPDAPPPAAAWDHLRWPDAWPGVEVTLRARLGGYERGLVVAPGADPTPIAFAFGGTSAPPTVAADGSLHVHAPGLAWTESAPAAWQDGPGGREPVAIAWEVAADDQVTLRLGAYDRARALYIDPLIPAGGLFGLTGLEDAAHDVVVGPDGTLYVTGGGHRDPRALGFTTRDAFVLAIAPDGALRWVSWFGGTRDFLLDPTCAELDADGGECISWDAHPRGLGGDDVGLAIDLRGDRLLVAGHTFSADFPATGGGRAAPFRGEAPTTRSRRDAFVAVLDRQDGALVQSGYLGGDGDDLVNSARFLDAARYVVLGRSDSSLAWEADLGAPTPTGPPAAWWQAFSLVPFEFDRWRPDAPRGFQGAGPAQVVEVFETPELRWALGDDGLQPLRWSVDPSGGPAWVDAMPTTGRAALVEAIWLGAGAGGAPRYAVIGVTNGEVGGFDGASCARATSTACPAGACRDAGDAFVAILEGNTCQSVTYIGGTGTDVPFAAARARLAPDRDWVVVVGRTASTDFPVRAGVQRLASGPVGVGVEAFYAVVDTATGALRMSSYLGLAPRLEDESFTSDDVATGVAITPAREAAIVGFTRTGLGEFVQTPDWSRAVEPGENGQAFFARLPLEVADLGIELAFDPTVTETAGLSTLMVTVRNTGTTAAHPVLIELTSPDLVFDPTGTPCVPAAAGLRCTAPGGGPLADGQTVSFPVTVGAPLAEGDYEVRGTVAAPQPDPYPDDNAAGADLIVGGVDLAVTLTPSATQAQPHIAPFSDAVPFTVEISNLGGDPAGATVLIDSAELGFHDLEVVDYPEACQASAAVGLSLLCTLPPIARGAPTRLAFVVRLPVEEGSILASTAEVRDNIRARVLPADDAPRDVNLTNNQAATPVLFRWPDLMAVFESAEPRTVGWDQPVTLRLAARNLGPGAPLQPSVGLLTDWRTGALPAGCGRLSDTLVVCEAPADTPPLAVGDTYRWSIPLRTPERVDGAAPREVRIPFAVKHAQPDAVRTNDREEAVLLLGHVEVRAEPPDPAPRYRVGIAEPVTWRITNAATERATGVRFQLRLGHAAGVELPIARVRGVNCAVVQGPTETTATCEVGALAGGESVNATFDVRAKGRGPLVAQGTITTAEPNAAGAASSPTVAATVIGPDLVGQLDVPAEARAPVRGQTMAFSVSAENIGDGRTTEGTNFSFGSTHPEVQVVVAPPPDACTATVGANPQAGATWQCARFVEPETSAPAVRVEVTPQRVGPLLVYAEAHDAQDEDATNARRELRATVRGAALRATVTLQDGQGAPLTEVMSDQVFRLGVTLHNDGPARAAQPEVHVRWDDATLLRPRRAPADPGQGCTEQPLFVRCPADSIDPQTTWRLDQPLSAGRSGRSTLVVEITERGDPGAPKLQLTFPLVVTRPDVEVTVREVTPAPPLSADVAFVARLEVLNTAREVSANGMEVTVRSERVVGVNGCDAPVAVQRVDSSAGPCADAGAGVWRCPIAVLTAREVVTLTVQGRSVCAGVARLTGQLRYLTDPAPDPNPANDTAHRTLEVADPSLSIEVDPAAPEGPYTAGLPVTVRVRSANGGGVSAGAEVDLTPPWRGGTFEVVTGAGTCAAAGDGVRCTLGAIAAGASAELTATAGTPDGPVRGTMRIEARTASGVDRANASVPMRLRGPDLALSALTAPVNLRVDDLAEWTFSVGNAGTAVAENGVVELTWPADRLTNVAVDGLGTCAATQTGRLCQLDENQRSPGSIDTATLTGRVRRAGDLTVTARAQSKYRPDEHPANDTVTLTATVAAPDLAATLAFQPDVAAPGEAVEARLVVVNHGTVASEATTATFAGGARLAVRRTPAGCTLSQGVVRCAVGPLAPGTAATFDFEVVPSAGADIVVEARVVSEPDQDPSNDRASATLRIAGLDSDGDSIPDTVEDAGPGGGDANGDGTPDRTQPHVASVPVAGFGALILEAPPGTSIASFGLVTPPAPPPAGVAFPMGAVAFEVRGAAAGALVPLRLTFPAGVPAWAWYKFDGGWTRLDWDGTTGGRVLGPRTLELVLRDGGRGDEDGVADGTVRDPGAPGLPIVVVDAVGDAGDLSPGDGACQAAGGGCTLRAALEEANASAAPAWLRFVFDAPVEIVPAAPLPRLTTPVVLDARGVPGTALGDPGVRIAGRALASGPLLSVEAEGVGLIDVGVEWVPGDGIDVHAAGFRFAGGSLGRPVGEAGPPQPWAALRAREGADRLTVFDAWVGSIAAGAGFGVVVAAEDAHLEGLTVNLNRLDGRRPQAEVPTGVHLVGARRATVVGLRVSGADVGLLIEGDCAGARVIGSTFGLGVDGFCHAFTRADPGPAETGDGPCLDGNRIGVQLRGARGVTIGGLGADEGNLFGDHAGDALALEAGSSGNALYHNRFGLAADGTCQPAAPDGLCRLYTGAGVRVIDSPDNHIGQTGAGNVFGAAALQVQGALSEDNVVEGNWGGFAGDLQTPLRPGFTSVTPVPFHVTGGARGTVVRDNTVGELWIGGDAGADTTATVVTGNRIGSAGDGRSLPSSGTHTLYVATAARGLRLAEGAHGTAVRDNAITSTVDWCVRVDGPADDLEFTGNHVGLSGDGHAALPCLSGGLRLAGGSSGARIEANAFGTCAAAASPTFQSACLLLGPGATDTAVRGNTFGVTRDGPGGAEGAVVANPVPGIIVGRAPRTLIEGNALFGTAPWGLYDRAAFEGDYAAPADGLTARGNRIGVDAAGLERGGVAEHGMLLAGSHARVGGLGAGEANRIFGSGGAGLAVGNVTGVSLRGNVLVDNAGLGIAFAGSTIPAGNDPGDGDGGPNGGQNHPLLGVYAEGPAPRVVATLASRALRSYTIDVYAVAEVDPSGHGEADEWLGAAALETGADGQGSVEIGLTRALALGERLTATATGAEGTSEFGPAARVVAAGLADLEVFLFPTDTLHPNTPGTLQVVVSSLGPDTAESVVADLVIPEGWSFDGPITPPSGACTLEGRRATCTGFDVAAFDVWEAFVAVRPGAVGTYVATLRADSLQADPAPANNAVASELLVGGVGYRLTARGQGFQANWGVGEVVPIEAQFFRDGPIDAIDDMTLTLTLPPTATIVGGDGVCTGPGPVWTCALGTVPARVATRTWRIDVVFGAAAQGLAIPLALRSPAPNFLGLARFDLFLNLAGAPPADLSLALAASPPAAVAGADVDLVATVSNPAAAESGPLLLTFTLPAGADLRVTDADCVGADGVVTCLAPPVPGGDARSVTARIGAPVAAGVARACVRRLDALDDPEGGDAAGRCAEVALGGRPYDVGVGLERAAVEGRSGTPLTLVARVHAIGGAPPTTLRWHTEGVAAAAGVGCEADPPGWRCPVPALAPGAEAQIALQVDPAAGSVSVWTAEVVAGGDADLSNNTATALVGAAAAADCPGLSATILLDTAAADLSAEGFVALEGGLLGAPAWRLAAEAGVLSTAPLVIPDDTATLRVEWLEQGLPSPGARRILEISEDGGARWRPVDHGEIDATLEDAARGEGPAYALWTLGAPPVGPLQVRWRASDAAPGAWDLGALRVVACTGGARGQADLAAVTPRVAAPPGEVAVVTFEVSNRAALDLPGAVVVLTGDAGVELLAGAIDGGACQPHPDGALRCTLDPLPAEATAGVQVWVRAEGETLAAIHAALSARAPLEPASARSATAWVRFGAAPLGARTELAWAPAVITASRGLPAAARLSVVRVGPAGAEAGEIELSAPAGLTVASADPRCGPTGLTYRCRLAPAADLRAEDAFDLEVTVAEEAEGGTLVATGRGAGDPGAVATAAVAVTLGDAGTLGLTLTAAEDHPPALEVTRVALRAEARDGAVGPSVLWIRAHENLLVRSATGPGIDCAVAGAEVRCALGALAVGVAVEVSLEVSPQEAGLAALTAGVERGPLGPDALAHLSWFAERDCQAHPCPLDDCLDTECSARVGCTATPRLGAACAWGEACGLAGVCAPGGCFGAGAVTCDDGLDCTHDTCGADGACEFAPAPGRCETGCTVGGWCEDLSCTGGVPRDCDDGDPCTAEICVEPGGCASAQVDTPECACRDLPVRRVCAEGVLVTLDGCDREQARTPCADDDPCTADACDPEAGCVYAPLDTPGCPGCTAQCEGRTCGPDPVCGAPCGTCPEGEVCAFGGCILNPCDDLQREGCCDDDLLATCAAGGFATSDCAEQGLGCGWSDREGAFVCGGEDTAPEAVAARCPWLPACEGDQGCGEGDLGVADGGGDLGVADGGGDSGPGDAHLDAGDPFDSGRPDSGRPDSGRLDGSVGGGGPDAGPSLGEEDDGCGCRSAPPSAAGPWLLALLALAPGVRRRRPRPRAR